MLGQTLEAQSRSLEVLPICGLSSWVHVGSLSCWEVGFSGCVAQRQHKRALWPLGCRLECSGASPGPWGPRGTGGKPCAGLWDGPGQFLRVTRAWGLVRAVGESSVLGAGGRIEA